MIGHKTKSIVFILLCLIFSYTIGNNSLVYAKSSAIEKIKDSPYDAFPKVKYAYKIFVLKNSYYDNKEYSYVNEYFTTKENKTNWSEKIIVRNFIDIKDPIEYGETIISGGKGEFVYTRKYKLAVLYYMPDIKSIRDLPAEQKLTKIEMNPKAPGIQVLQYINKITDKNIKTANDSAKLIKEKYTTEILLVKIPHLVQKSFSSK